MKRRGINFFQHWKISLAFGYPIFFVLNMSTGVVLVSGCIPMAIASVMQRAVFSGSVWMRSVRRPRKLLPVSFPLMCVRMLHVSVPIC